MQNFLYFGLFMLVIWLNWIFSNTSAAFCNCKNITLCEEVCNVSEGSHSLSCFGQRYTKTQIKYHCSWNPGKYDQYFLYIKQRICRQINLGKTPFTSLLGPFSLTIKTNMTAFSTALSDDQKRCAFAKFSTQPLQIIQCGPPSNVTFKRGYGHLNVTAKWDDGEVDQYYLRYREHNATVWKKVTSQNSRDCTVGNVVPSQSYEMQIRCVESSVCPRCPFSAVIGVPPELADAPIIVETHYDLVRAGLRKITVEWKHVHSDAVEVYNVTIQKASQEPAEDSSYFPSMQSVTLYLSYSAYKLSISALNKAGLSPAVMLDIDAMEDLRELDEAFNVTLNSNTSCSLSWNNTLTRKYHCYSVEWWATNEKLAYEPFYVKKSYHTFQTQNVAFQPYKRYHFLLHARHEKDTCNLKKFNNTDQTFGRTQIYLTEGTPLAAPGNVGGSNVTHSSFVITWSPVSEEDLRGFLQGYIIHYTQDNSKKNITVPPSVNSYELLNLRSGSIYCIQLSAYTAAGAGKRSASKCFDTSDPDAVNGMLIGFVAGILVLLLTTHLCFQLMKRSKKVLWPSIPNPCNSNAVQKIEGGHDLDLELTRRPFLEETEAHVSVLEATKETNSACIVSHDWNKGLLTPNPTPPPEDNEPLSTPTAPIDSTPFPTDANHKASTEDPHVGANDIKNPPTVLDTASVPTAVANLTGAFISDYTTMELFQQITNAVPPLTSSSGATNTQPQHNYLSQSLALSQNAGEAPD